MALSTGIHLTTRWVYFQNPHSLPVHRQLFTRVSGYSLNPVQTVLLEISSLHVCLSLPANCFVQELGAQRQRAVSAPARCSDGAIVALHRIWAIEAGMKPRSLGEWGHPHTPRSSISSRILPSTSGLRTLGFPKSDRDCSRGWAAENSDRYARVARLKIQTMQKAVSRSFSIPASEDPLGEAETLTQLEQYMSLNLPNVPEDVRSKCLVSLGIREPETVVHKQPMVTTDTPVVEPFLLFSSSSSAARPTSVTLLSAPTDPESDGARPGAPDGPTQEDRQRSHPSSGEQPA